MGPGRLREQLREAYRRLLNPLIRILIRNGVTATEATDLVRRAYVDALLQAQMGPVVERIAQCRRHRLRPRLELLPVAGVPGSTIIMTSLTGAIALTPDSPHSNRTAYSFWS